MSSTQSRSAHILIVEDDAGNLLMARTALERAGYSVDGASSAEEARALLQNQQPDLILMDLMLPGIDGLEFTRQLKADPDTEGIPVVALTGQAMPVYERLAHAAGCDGFMIKVASPSALSAQVGDFLESLTASPKGSPPEPQERET